MDNDVINKAPFGVIITDRQGLLQDCNIASEKILGAPRKRILGKDIKSFIHPEYVDEHQQVIERLAEKEIDIERLHLQVKHQKGSYRWVELMSYGIFSRKKELQQIVAFLSDIQSLTEIEKKLAVSKNLKMDELRTILRDFNDELNKIQLASSMLQIENKDVNESLYNYSAVITAACQRSKKIIEDLGKEEREHETADA